MGFLEMKNGLYIKQHLKTIKTQFWYQTMIMIISDIWSEISIKLKSDSPKAKPIKE